LTPAPVFLGLLLIATGFWRGVGAAAAGYAVRRVDTMVRWRGGW